MIRVTQLGPQAAQLMIDGDDVTVRLGETITSHGHTVSLSRDGLDIDKPSRSAIYNNANVTAENFLQADSINNLDLR